MEGIHEILNALFLSSGKAVLATIIKVDGSAYRKEGTSMLLRENGEKTGLLSGGCLENDLSCQVSEVIQQNVAKTIKYDMQSEDDSLWGQGAGCNGAVTVLLEPIDAFFYDQLRKLKYQLDLGNRVTIIKKLTIGGTVSDYLFLSDDGQLFGKWHGGVPKVVKRAIAIFHNKTPKSGIRYLPDLGAEIYVHSFRPKPRLIVFGAGADAIPLVRIASAAGFSVSVADWRDELCREAKFPSANECIVGFPREIMNRLKLSKNDSVLIQTHQFQRDQEILQHIRNKELAYLGVLGPRKRTQRLLNGEEIPSAITSPAGLAIEAEGPEEIAISIVAELIQRQRVKKAEGAISS
ncbi:XdhC family protein [Mesobacillus harenae]|uniref:XdhC family protein n=1 Tax=Mesobacillus harenae TaxID=2213203 RepID=UPI0015800F08|nr:XdhC family protein [Mesobacillus harenae]